MGLLLGGVEVPVPAGAEEAEASLRALAGERHRVRGYEADVEGYAVQRAADPDHGPRDRGGPALLRRGARLRPRAGRGRGGAGLSYERLRSERLFEGRFFDVVRERVRYEDGSEHEREFARHPGAVAILPHDSGRIFMVRQPRESVGEADLLELPAGKLDVEGESPLDCARRELREEIGMSAGALVGAEAHLHQSRASPARRSTCSRRPSSSAVGAEPTEGERIEVVTYPIAEIDAVIESCLDATSLIGLLLFRERLAP